MSGVAVLRSSFATSLARYSRSWGLWVLLLIAPIEARLWISTGSEPRAVIAVQGMAPVMTSAMLGVSLGIVISMLLLPAAFLYLRANATRLQPWQVEEVTPAPRVAVALGRFGADALVLLAALAATTVAGWVIGWLVVPAGTLDIGEITLALWLIAAAALIGVAALRILFDAIGFTRGALGELLYVAIWLASIILPIASEAPGTGFAYNLGDFAGFVQPLTNTLPHDRMSIAIGSSRVGAEKIALDVMAGIRSDGYVASRLAWIGIAVLVAALAGLVYAPHRPRARRQPRFARFLAPGAPRPADMAAPPAHRAQAPLAGLLAAEMRLIAGGRLWLALAGAAAVASPFVDFRHAASPAALLLLVFGLSAHAGRSERTKLLALTATAPLAPAVRRLAFVAAGTLWSVAIGAPGIVRAALTGSLAPLELALATGAAASAVAIVLAAVSRSAFAPRLVLLLLWYVYFSAN